MNLPTVLIVDDDVLVRSLLKDALADVDARLVEACDGDEALAALSREHPELVLLDLLMPGRSGLELLPEICGRTRVLVVSSMDAESLVQQALGAGAEGFIAKPFHPVEVRSAVLKVLATGAA